MATGLAVTFATLLLVSVSVSLWRRLPSWTLIDLFMLAIALYFGAYTLVDAVSVESGNLEPLCVAAVFIIVATGSLVLWLAARLKAFPETSLARLKVDWRTCPAAPIVCIVALALAFRWYTSVFFSEFGDLGEQDLLALEQTLPYWYTSIGMIVSTTIFAAAFCAWGKVGISRGWRRLFWLAMTATSAALIFGIGRRAILTFLIVVGWTVLVEQRGKRWVTVMVIALAMPVLIAVSNVYQAYRAVSYRGVPLDNIVTSQDIGSLFEEAAAVERTVANLQERPAMWRFNYEVVSAHASGNGSLQWGTLLLGDIPNYIPSVLYPRKEWVDSEDVLLQRFNLERYDRPSNLFSYTYADVGLLSALAAPGLMLLFCWLCAFALRRLRDPFLRSVLMGMAIYYAISLETGYLAPLAMARDFLIVAAIYLLARSAMRGARSLFSVRVAS